jgi:hypothetical protein
MITSTPATVRPKIVRVQLRRGCLLILQLHEAVKRELVPDGSFGDIAEAIGSATGRRGC